MIGNFYATQFLVSQESLDTGFFIRQESVDEVTSLTSESRGGFVFAIMYYHVKNAAGTTAVPAFNIANPSVDEREFVVYKVMANNHGHLCFPKLDRMQLFINGSQRKPYCHSYLNVVTPINAK